MSDFPHIHISLQKDENGYPPFDSEELDASLVEGDLYRIEGVPVFAKGLARGDTVRVVRVTGEDGLWVVSGIENSGHWTVRVMPWDRGAVDTVLKNFQALGCYGYVSHGLVALDIAPDVPAQAIMEALDQGFDSGEWDFDVGVSPE